MKHWMKQRVNRSKMKTVLDKPENVGWKISSRTNFQPTRFFFVQQNFLFFFCYFCVLLNRSSISSNKGFLICWMKCLDRFNKALNPMDLGKLKLIYRYLDSYTVHFEPAVLSYFLIPTNFPTKWLNYFFQVGQVHFWWL